MVHQNVSLSCMCLNLVKLIQGEDIVVLVPNAGLVEPKIGELGLAPKS